MSASSGFLWRFLDDVWDLLPTEDRQLFETYWSSFLQIGGQLQTKVTEAALSPVIETVPLYLIERWNRYRMDESSCDLFQKAETLRPTGLVPAPLGVASALYDTLSVSAPSGRLWLDETIEFFDGGIRTLRYGELVRNSVSVKISVTEFTEGHDYVVNYVAGTIQALPEGRLPIDQVATVHYAHARYTRGLDYELDETRATLVRLPGSTIGDAEAVVATYSYNATPTVPLQSSSGLVPATLATLVDATQDFSALLPNRTLTVVSGPNAGQYLVTAIPSAHEVSVQPVFAVAQTDGGVTYTIDAFPHGQRIAKNIRSIPTLQDRIDEPAVVLQEGIDFVVSSGVLASRAAFPMMTLGPSEDRKRSMWAEKTLVDRETPYRNFGVLINFYRENAEAYKQALQGLWYTFWTGSTPGNLRQGLHILLGLPYARSAGTVVSLFLPTPTQAGSAQIQDGRGQILTYVLPAELDAAVALGQVVSRFTPLTTGVKVIDRNSEPGFVAGRLGRAGISRFLTASASRGPGDTDETKALELLEHHLFIPQVLTEALTSQVNVKELVTFLSNMKPAWTEFVFAFNAEVAEDMHLDAVGEVIVAQTTIDATTTVNNNEGNRIEADAAFLVARATGELVIGGQETGNFQDRSVDFAALGVGRGDYVRISTPGVRGHFRVLARVSRTLLSIDLADAALAPMSGLRYVVLPVEILLGHDAVNLKREHIDRPGTAFGAPTVLNVRTDAPLDGLEDVDLTALFLVDAANVGNEVQPITGARVDLGEVEVGVPPPAGPRTHRIAAATLVRRQKSGAITDVMPI